MQLLFFPPAWATTKCFMSSICSGDTQWIKVGKAHLLKPSKQEQIISVLLTYTTDLLHKTRSCTGWIFLGNNKNTLLDKWWVRKREHHENLSFFSWTGSCLLQLIWSPLACEGGRREQPRALCWFPRGAGRAPSHLPGSKGPRLSPPMGDPWPTSAQLQPALLLCWGGARGRTGVLHPIPSAVSDWN